MTQNKMEYIKDNVENNLEYHCPKCYYIPIYEINEKNFTSMTITCINKHIFNYSISDFFKDNPFKISEIKCKNCPPLEKNITNDLLYCIQCKVYLCNNHKNEYHCDCKNIINIKSLYS